PSATARAQSAAWYPTRLSATVDRRPKKSKCFSVFLGDGFQAVLKDLRIEASHAIRTKTVSKLGVGMGLDEFLYLIPVVFVIADFLAGGADWEQTSESFDFRQGVLEFENQPFALIFGPFSISGVLQAAFIDEFAPVRFA